MGRRSREELVQRLMAHQERAEQLTRELRAHTPQLIYPQDRQVLAEQAHRIAEHAKLLRESLYAVGGKPVEVEGLLLEGGRNWDRIALDLKLAEEYEYRLDVDVHWVTQRDPKLGELLGELREEGRAVRKALVQLLAKLDPYGR
ncbi:MAG: hypothetical protein HYV08_17735 [Deltaproteobacteria bacterium]|nr:hypothetical protein [Deltaproteobacteria bacterium]